MMKRVRAVDSGEEGTLQKEAKPGTSERCEEILALRASKDHSARDALRSEEVRCSLTLSDEAGIEPAWSLGD